MVRALSPGNVLCLLCASVLAACSEQGGPSAAAPAASTEAPQELGGYRYQPIAVPKSNVPAVPLSPSVAVPQDGFGPGAGGDKYALLEDADFLSVGNAPLSTFSIDVDTASYSKTRAYLLEHRTLPPADAVRIEELINYFDYSYGDPEDEHPFAVHLETAACSWQPQHRLIRIGLQGRRGDNERPPSNLVFLIDVSGSMSPANRLPLVQRGLSMLVKQLGPADCVSIVVYAGAAGRVLPPTSGTEKAAILTAINNLRAGGSTNGGQGIQLAYQLALDNFVDGGVNRVILCTDGDFNVGTTSTAELVRLAQRQAQAGIYLSVLGFGFGNHNDALLEQIANKANGNYAFIDNDREAHKLLVEQLQGTLVTIAKDVKLQVEFNPATVAAYRLIGYENRKLADRDFNDDTKDAGEIGAGHSVTALYEIVPAGAASALGSPSVDPLKYQSRQAGHAGGVAVELLTLKLRYQSPAGGPSTLLTYPLRHSQAPFHAASSDMQFAAAVASFGMLLRNSRHKGNATYASVLEMANAARGHDKRGLRNDFLELVKTAQQLAGENSSSVTTAWPQARVANAARAPSMPAVDPSRRPSAWIGLAIGLAAGWLVTGLVAAIAFFVLRAATQTMSFECSRSLSMKPSALKPRQR